MKSRRRYGLVSIGYIPVWRTRVDWSLRFVLTRSIITYPLVDFYGTYPKIFCFGSMSFEVVLPICDTITKSFTNDWSRFCVLTTSCWCFRPPCLTFRKPKISKFSKDLQISLIKTGWMFYLWLFVSISVFGQRKGWISKYFDMFLCRSIVEEGPLYL